MNSHEPSTRPAGVWLILLAAALFAVAHTQAPLYFSNQHQYFLHGLARAGDGDLAADWLANTADPTPAFSSLVAVTAKYLHPYLFHVYYFALLMTYGVCLARIAGACGMSFTPGRLLAFFALLSLVHAGIMRWASVRLTGIDYPWYLQSGIAGQYLLGPGLQPSAFGVLMLASIAAYVADRPYLAVLLAAAAALMHFTYFLTAGMLVIGYVLPAFRAGRVRHAVSLMAVALAAVSPGLIYSAWTFAPESMETANAAHEILVNFRIPHHTLPQKWFDAIAAMQLIWIAFGIALTWRTRLFPIVVSIACLSAILTAAHLIRPTHFVSLLFPWRSTALLMPIATAVILARCVQLLALIQHGRLLATASCLLLLLTVAAGGIWIMAARQAYHQNSAELPMLEHVRTNRKPRDVYLLPIKAPKLAGGKRGSISTSFTPPPRPKDKHLIAVDLLRFRLHTGAAIFIDFKSIPYKDTEVLEWRSRLTLAEHWYEKNAWDDPEIRAELARYGITHVVAAHPYRPRGRLALEFSDSAYRVYRVLNTD